MGRKGERGFFVYVELLENDYTREIKPRPDRLGLGAMPLVMDKQRRKSAVKRSKADQEASKAYTGVKKEKEDMYASVEECRWVL